MGQVVGLEVVRVEARPFGAEGVVLRAQGLGRPRVDDRRSDLLPEHLCDDLVGGRVEHLVVEHTKDGKQLAGLPRRFEPLASDVIRGRDAADLRDLPGHTAARPSGRLPVLRAAGGEPVETLRRGRPVVGRYREVGGALKHGELGGLGRDQRDRLDPRRTGADHRHPVPPKVDAIVGPGAREVHLAGEEVGPFDIRRLREGEATAGHHVEAASDVLPAPSADLPPPGRVVPRR